MSFDDKFKDFDKRSNRAWNFAWVWFVFVGLLTLGLLGGSVYVVIRILSHFGIL